MGHLAPRLEVYMSTIPEQGCYIFDYLRKDVNYTSVGISADVSKALQTLVPYEMCNKDFHLLSTDNRGRKVYLYIYDFEDMLITINP